MSVEIAATHGEPAESCDRIVVVRSGLHLPARSRLGKETRGIQPAVFLDRDGVLVRDVHYLRHFSQIELLPQVETLLRLEERFYLIVATNQSGIARGMFTEDDLTVIHAILDARLEALDITVDAFYYCPHLPTGSVAQYRTVCACRKPAAGMLLDAARDWNVPLGASYMIGDSERDVAAGKAAGLAGNILVGGDAGTLEQAVESILEAPRHG